MFCIIYLFEINKNIESYVTSVSNEKWGLCAKRFRLSGGYLFGSIVLVGDLLALHAHF